MTSLYRGDTEVEMTRLFRKLSLAEFKLVQSCLQSIADERDAALGRVKELEAEKIDARKYLETVIGHGQRSAGRVAALESHVEVHTMCGDDANLMLARVIKWSSDQVDLEPDEIKLLAESVYTDFMTIMGWGIPADDGRAMIIDDDSDTKPITKEYRDQLLADLKRREKDGTAEVCQTEFASPGRMEKLFDQHEKVKS